MTPHSEASAGRPACVLLAGQLCDKSIFAQQAASLAAVADVDVRLVTKASVDEAVEDVLGSRKGKMAVVGFSLGGIVALSCALRAPERISHLGLLCANPHAPWSEQISVWQRWSDLVDHNCFDVVINEVVHAMLRPGADDQFRLRVLAMAEAVRPEEFANQLALQQTRTSLVEDLGTITAPTLIVGGENDPLCPPEYQKVIEAGIEGANLRIESDAGHLLPWERSREVTSMIARLLSLPSGARPHDAGPGPS